MDQFNNIALFLKETFTIWWEEILYLYPYHERVVDGRWIDELESLSPEKLFQVVGRRDFSHVESSDLKEIITKIERLTKVPLFISTSDIQVKKKLPFNRIRGKKEHELLQLELFFSHFLKTNSPQLLCDYCGGMGHLAQFLSYLFAIPTYSIDFDASLQKEGKMRYDQYHTLNRYQHLAIEDPKLISFLQTLPQKRFDLGLHTCGPMSLQQFELSIESKAHWLLNFGCCYHKLKDESHYNLSQQGKIQGLKLSASSLTLATRSKTLLTERGFERKFSVKVRRYALFIWLYHHAPEYAFIPLGNSPMGLYDAPFATYAKEQLKRFPPLKYPPSDQALNDFYHDPKLQRIIKRMILIGCIRNEWGAVIELYLQLDRVLYLRERGYDATIMSFFDPALSPRHLGIYATSAL